MLHLPLDFEGHSVSGKLTRRQLLHVGGLSMLGLGLPGALRANDSGIPARAREPGAQASASDVKVGARVVLSVVEEHGATSVTEVLMAEAPQAGK